MYLRNQIESIISLVEAGESNLPDFIGKFKNTLDEAKRLENQLTLAELQHEKLEEQIKDLKGVIHELRRVVLPTEQLVAREKELEANQALYDKDSLAWQLERKYLIRENKRTTDILSSILSRQEIRDSIWTEYTYVQSDHPSGGGYTKPTVCRKREEVTHSPVFKDAGEYEQIDE